ncbi:MAG: V0D/AC39 family V-type ATPase subunit [Candidatus Bathyarchaeia archaeon]
MKLGLDYVVVRTHARIADLLTLETMDELAEAEGIHGFLERLEDTPYGKISIEGEERVPLALERIFSEKFIERIQQIVKLTPAKMGDFLRAYYDMRFEVVNLKRILRGKYSGVADQEIIDSLIPIESYLAPDHVELAEKETLEDVVKALEDSLYRALGERMDLYRTVGALWPFELTLNSIYSSNILMLVEELPSQARNMIRSIVAFETDIENVLIAIKQREMSEEARRRFEEMFPVTFSIDIKKLKEITEAKNLRPAIESLGGPYKEVLSPIYAGDIALIRTSLRRNKYEITKNAKARGEFGFNVIMAYLVYSEIEKDNLVGLAWGKVQGLPAEELLKYVVIPRD